MSVVRLNLVLVGRFGIVCRESRCVEVFKMAQGWVSASRKPVSDETRQKPVRKAGIYHFPTSEMSEMSETSDQKFFFPKNHFLFK